MYKRSDKKSAGRKAGGVIFFLTLVRSALPSRESVLEFLCNLLPVIYYAIGLEKHHDGSNHYHVFIELSVSMTLTDLTPVLISHCACNVQSVRNRRSVLHYLSKEDANTLHNVSDSSLHVNYRIHKWLKRTRTFSLLDPFVMSLGPSYYKYLEAMFLENQSRKCTNTWVPITCAYIGWYLAVAEWLNDFMLTRYCHKKKQLFLWGESNIGKTSCVRCVTSGLRVYTPDIGSFAFGDLTLDYYDIIVFEEFEFSNYNESTLKRLLEGDTVRLAIKGRVGRVLKWQKPIIMVSNHCPSGYPWFLNRVKVVEAVGPFWCEDRVPMVKSEIQREETVDLTISSEEEDNVPPSSVASSYCSESPSCSSSSFYNPGFYLET